MATQSSQDAQIKLWIKTWPKIVARAWSDDEFMARLVREPVKVAEEEYNLPVLKNFRVHITSGTTAPTLLLSIPPKPDDLKGGKAVEALARKRIEDTTCGESCTF